eukprot:jgi/Mesvir1/14371/Mv09771-RA.1
MPAPPAVRRPTDPVPERPRRSVRVVDLWPLLLLAVMVIAIAVKVYMFHGTAMSILHPMARRDKEPPAAPRTIRLPENYRKTQAEKAQVVGSNAAAEAGGQAAGAASASAAAAAAQEMLKGELEAEKKMRAQLQAEVVRLLEQAANAAAAAQTATVHLPAALAGAAPPQDTRGRQRDLLGAAVPLSTAFPTSTHQDIIAESKFLHQAASRAAKGDRYLHITYGNIFSAEMLRNWLAHLQGVGDTHALVMAMDEELVALCAELGVPAYHLNMEKPQDVLSDNHGGKKFLSGYDKMRLHQDTFRVMGGYKVKMLQELTNLGYTVLFSDTDTVWMRNPWPYLHTRHLEADMMVTSDCLSHVGDQGADPTPFPENTWYRCGHTSGRIHNTAFNTGVLFMRPNRRTTAFLQHWRATLLDYDKDPNPGLDDQLSFVQQSMIGAYPIQLVSPGSRVFYGLNGLQLGVFPIIEFMNGHGFFLQKLHLKNNMPRPYVVHVTFTNGGFAGKRHRLREAGLWKVESQEYYSEGNFLAINVPFGLRELNITAPDVDSHVKISGQQLRAVRDGLAIAQILNRTLILPPLVAHCDRDCGGCGAIEAGCKIKGSEVGPPWVIPVDMLFDTTLMEANFHDRFREHTFLDNPRVPPEVKRSRVWVDVIKREELKHIQRDPAVGAVVANGWAVLPESATEAEVHQWLGPYRDVRVLELSDAARAFCRFTSDDDSHGFQKRWDMLAQGGESSGWCCEDKWIPVTGTPFRHYPHPDDLSKLLPGTCPANMGS